MNRGSATSPYRVGVALWALAAAVAWAQSWTTAPSAPTARSEVAAAVAGGEIYVAGGLDAQGRSLDAFEAFDPAAGTWRRAADLPEPLHHFGMATLDGRVCITGGYRTLDFVADVSAAWCYDPAGDAWEPIADLPAPRAAHAMVAAGGRLLVVGGVGPDPVEVWAYDPAEDAWRALADLPTPREHLAAAVVDGEVHVVGGRWPGAGNLATLEIYDPEADAWRRGEGMPTPRGGLTAGAVDGRLYVTGGEAFRPERTFGETEVYDPRSGTWSVGPPLPTPRHGLASAVADGDWFVVGGGPRAGLSASGVMERLEAGPRP